MDTKELVNVINAISTLLTGISGTIEEVNKFREVNSKLTFDLDKFYGIKPSSEQQSKKRRRRRRKDKKV